MSRRSPHRLVDDAAAPPSLRSDLEGARAKGLAELDLAEGRRRLEALLASIPPPAGPGGGAPPGQVGDATSAPPASSALEPGSAAARFALRFGIGTVLLAGLGGGVALLPHMRPEPAGPAAPSAPAAAASADARPVVTVVGAPLAPRHHTSAKPAAADHPAAPPGSSPPPVARPAATLPAESELALQRRLVALARRDASAALELAEHGNVRFPRGLHLHDREAIAIESLARLGQRDRARARFAAFEQRWPVSPMRALLSRTLADAGAERRSPP